MRNYATPTSASTTPESASRYLSDLLELPPSAAFPPQLALQLLTHKSYRFVHRLTNMSEEELVQSQVSHNARFSFLGRRALASYLAMFLHAQVRTSEGAHALEFLKGKDIETRLADILHENNVGRWVGDRWGVQNVMRWTANQVSSVPKAPMGAGTALQRGTELPTPQLPQRMRRGVEELSVMPWKLCPKTRELTSERHRVKGRCGQGTDGRVDHGRRVPAPRIAGGAARVPHPRPASPCAAAQGPGTDRGGAEARRERGQDGCGRQAGRLVCPARSLCLDSDRHRREDRSEGVA